jgi:NADPH:quinone reductase-like Zn-dependent oxidoreductase
MKAITQQRYGGPEMLSFVDVDRPEPAAGEVLVRVRAAAVNAADWHIMRGDPYLARLAAPAIFGRTGPKQPIRGRDVAGVVEALGTGVDGFAVGDEVYGDLGDTDGAFAEFVAAPAARFAAKPASLTFEEAAAVPLAGGTALAALRAGGVLAGQRVLINGASGGVGTFAVQIAAAWGAEVTAVCSARNVEQVKALGAHRVLDYGRTDFTREPVRQHVVLDVVGNRSLRDLRRALTPDGTAVLAGGGVSGGRPSVVGPMGLLIRAGLLDRFVAHRLLVFTGAPDPGLLAELRDLIDAGCVTPVVERTYPLAAATDAVRHLETEHARGKIVVTVA